MTSRLEILGRIRFDLLLVALLSFMTLFVIIQKRKDNNRYTGSSKYLTLLILYILCSIPFVYWPGSAIRFGVEGFIKAIVFYYFTVIFATSEKKLKILIFVFMGVQSFRVLEPLYLHITQGYWGSKAFMTSEFLDRLAGAPHDIVNPNGLAYIIVSIIPFFYFLAPISPKYTALCLIPLPLFFYALVLTSSRSGMIGLFVILLGMFIKTKRKLLFSIIVMILAFVMIAKLGEKQRDRYVSIVDSSAANAPTAEGRLEGIESDLLVAFHKPFFGHGIGTSREANANFSGRDQPSHTLYTEIAQEIGFLGLIIFLFFMKSIFTNFAESYKTLRHSLEKSLFLMRLVDAMQVWLAMNILFSFASYGLSGYAWYLFAGFSVVVMRLSSQVNTEEKRPSGEDIRP